ncbi:MBL fold metallo-hydrolase [Microbacterium sp.]|uniref:MBL fold metallo-hydrolase n=1 Tax=Microbacterium sp. TaxID=51671 RepID=UPI00262A82FA|nr:MBL fold metallo-hydrolase [uncultured Microbacterium sp.]
MRITKFEHAALRIDEQDASLLIDPGSFTAPIDGLDRVVAVVITHEHADHWTPAHLDAVLTSAPNAKIFAPAGVAAAAGDYDITVVSPGDAVSAGPFSLRFFGGTHEVIHSSLPVVDNVGVLVNDAVYYPGDSYAVPGGVDVDVLAAPLSAPWLRIGDAFDFVTAVHARRVFGTHDIPLSDIGRSMHRGHLQRAVDGYGGQFLALNPGDVLDV